MTFDTGILACSVFPAPSSHFNTVALCAGTPTDWTIAVVITIAFGFALGITFAGLRARR